MSPHHFAKQMNNPYFRTDHYKNESSEMKVQRAFEAKLRKLLFWKKKKIEDKPNNN